MKPDNGEPHVRCVSHLTGSVLTSIPNARFSQRNSSKGVELFLRWAGSCKTERTDLGNSDTAYRSSS